MVDGTGLVAGMDLVAGRGLMLLFGMSLTAVALCGKGPGATFALSQLRGWGQTLLVYVFEGGDRGWECLINYRPQSCMQTRSISYSEGLREPSEGSWGDHEGKAGQADVLEGDSSGPFARNQGVS